MSIHRLSSTSTICAIYCLEEYVFHFLDLEDYAYGYPVKDSQTLRVYMRESEPKHSERDYFNGYKKGYKAGRENAYENIKRLATDELNRST